MHEAANQNITFAKDGNGSYSGASGIQSINDANSAYAPLGFYASQYDLAGGNVGIGISTPALTLDVRGTAGSPATTGTAQTGVARFTAASGSSAALDFGSYSSGLGTWLQSTNYANLATNETLSLNPNGGNVGIGTATPNYTLEVQGTASTTKLFATNATTTNLFSTTASSTNLYSQAASVGTLAANSLTLTSALPILSGGTNQTTFTSGQLLSYNGTSFVSTSTIGNNQLQNSAISINGSSVSLGGSITVASTTLLSNNNTWSGTQTFGNTQTTNSTTTGSSYLGTVLGGTWQGTAIGSQYGGTGQDFHLSNGLAAINAGVWSAISTTSMNASITGSAGSVAASALTGTTLASGVTGSSLTSFGASPTLGTPVINGLPTGTGVATANTPSTLVARDASGNFSAGTITANITGNVSGSAGSVAASAITGTTLASGVTASSLTSVGTIGTGVWAGTAVGATHGGTGVSSVTTGDLLYGSASNTWANLADVAVGKVLISGGVGVAPSWGNLSTLTFGTHLASGGSSYNGSAGVTITSDATNANTASTIVARDASGNFSAGTISAALTGNVTGNVSGTAATVTGATQASITTLSNLVSTGTITSGTWSGSFGAVSGASLTSLTAANITGSHTLPDSVLSTNVPLLNAANAFTNTGRTSFGGEVTASEGTWGTGGYSFNQDGSYDTGMFSPSDGVIDFYDNQVHSININASGQATFLAQPHYSMIIIGFMLTAIFFGGHELLAFLIYKVIASRSDQEKI